MFFRGKFSKYFNNYKKQSRRIYLDHASATPMTKAVVKAMEQYFIEDFANASAIHSEGRRAKKGLDQARVKVARLLQVQDEHVVFTSGGTESNNIAILGYIKTLHQEQGIDFSEMVVLTTKLEHPSVLQACAELTRWGVQVQYMPLTDEGVVDIAKLPEKLSKNTVLLSLAHINSELGIVQPTQAIAKLLKKCKSEARFTYDPLLHLDAAQSPLWYRCDLERLGADMLSIDAAKCGGPKGVGVLTFARRRCIDRGVLYGGGQEFGLRPGTEPVGLIVGAAYALEEAQKTCQKRAESVRKVRDLGISYIEERLPESVLNGPIDEARAPYNINISIPGFDTEYLAIVLDSKGVAVSTKSACSSIDSEESSVVYQLTNDHVRAKSTLRLTLREEVSAADLSHVVDLIKDHVANMRPYTTKE